MIRANLCSNSPVLPGHARNGTHPKCRVISGGCPTGPMCPGNLDEIATMLLPTDNGYPGFPFLIGLIGLLGQIGNITHKTASRLIECTGTNRDKATA